MENDEFTTETPPEVQKKSKTRRLIVIIEVVLLVGLGLIILTYKPKKTAVRTVGESYTPMVEVVKTPASEKKEPSPPEVKPSEQADKTKDVQIVPVKSTATKKEELPAAGKPKEEPPKVEKPNVSEKEEAAPAAKTEVKGYFLQIGVFSLKENYDESEGKMKELGFLTHLKMAKKEGVSLYILRIGPYDSKEKALSIKEELAKKGIESYLFDK